MLRCALLTMSDIGDYIAYDHLLIAPLARLGWQAELVAWDVPTDWDGYEAVIIRSPWDYQDRLAAFMAVLGQIEQSSALLLNPLSVVQWNHDKRYLQQLQQQGCVIVPTCFVEQVTAADVARAFVHFGSDRLILKPVISAAALNTHVLDQASWQQQWPAIQPAFQQRVAMLQPFVEAVLSEGEYSLFYFAGEFSHAIVKLPRPGDFRVQEEYGSKLQNIKPEQDLLLAADQALQVTRAITETDLLYARVDLVRLADGTVAIMELELIEPSLYFNMDVASPERFAAAFAAVTAVSLQ
jgi:glutathione synthase/RimK-type ligase-like ATP-grasp enzyme